MAGILWIASYPKSGNTWMRVFLANLILDTRQPLPINEIGKVCTSEANAIWYKPLTDRPLDSLSEEEMAALRPEAQHRAARLNRNVVPMKTHNMLGEHHGRPLISMDVTYGAVYLVRDPRDVAISARHHYGVDLDTAIEMMGSEMTRSEAQPGETIYEFQASWSTHVKSWTQRPHPTLKVLRYEDLLAEPVKLFTEVAKHFRITSDPARIRRAIDAASFKELQRQESKDGFVERSHKTERFFRKGQAGGWREVLTPEQARAIEKRHAVQMRRFHYI